MDDGRRGPSSRDDGHPLVDNRSTRASTVCSRPPRRPYRWNQPTTRQAPLQRLAVGAGSHCRLPGRAVRAGLGRVVDRLPAPYGGLRHERPARHLTLAAGRSPNGKLTRQLAYSARSSRRVGIKAARRASRRVSRAQRRALTPTKSRLPPALAAHPPQARLAAPRPGRRPVREGAGQRASIGSVTHICRTSRMCRPASATGVVPKPVVGRVQPESEADGHE